MMGCACSVEVVDLDNASRVATDWCKIRTARVTHKCDECHRTIAIGETYEHYTGICDGSFFKNKTCVDCLSIRDAFFDNGYYFGQVMGDFREFISEGNGQVSEECLSALTPRAREMACELIQRVWLELSLDFPTDPAFRLKKRFERLKYRNGWEMQRDIEIGKMDRAVWGTIEAAKTKKTGPQAE